jgi:hypothetical protein
MKGLGDLFPGDNYAHGPLPVPQPAGIQILQALANPQTNAAFLKASSGAPLTAAEVQSAMPFQWQAGYSRNVIPEDSHTGMFRPQYAFAPAPSGFHDEDFVHTYNSINTPAFGLVAGNVELRDIVLQLEPDAIFLLRGLKIIVDDPTFSFGYQFREPGGKFLSRDPVRLNQGYLGGVLLSFVTGAFAVSIVPIEPEIECPPGGVFLLNILNVLGTPANAALLSVSLFGVKRYADCKN